MDAGMGRGYALAAAVLCIGACLAACRWLQPWDWQASSQSLGPHAWVWGLAALLLGGLGGVAKGQSASGGAGPAPSAGGRAAQSHALSPAGSAEEEVMQQLNGTASTRPTQQGPAQRGNNVALRLLRAFKQRWQKAGEQVRTACARPAARLQQSYRKASGARSPNDGSSRGSGHGGMWRRQRSRGSSWQPSMARILSGQNLSSMLQDDSSSMSTSTNRARGSRGGAGKAEEQGCEMPLVPHAGHLAVDCMTHDTTMPAAAEVTQVVTTQHLLQFGALLGESSAELALSQTGAPGAQGTLPACLLGSTDEPGSWARGWEQLVRESCAQRGLHYWAWRRYLRKGLYMYKSRTVFEGITPLQLAAFYLDDAYKGTWDDTCMALEVIPPASGDVGSTATSTAAGVDSSAGDVASCLAAERASDDGTSCAAGAGPAAGVSCCGADAAATLSCYMYARARFPAPMSQREYVYARRVWAKADDGGCYVLSRAHDHPGAPAAPCRTVRVQDYVSGTVIRESSLADGCSPSAEIVTVYFEDSHVSPGILNLGVRKGLWPHVQKLEAALRRHLCSPAGLTAQLATSAALQQACCRNSSLQQQQQGQSVAAASALRRCASMGGGPESPAHRRSNSGSCSSGSDALGGVSDTAAARRPLVHVLSTPAVPALATASAPTTPSASMSCHAVKPLVKAPATTSPFAQLAGTPGSPAPVAATKAGKGAQSTAVADPVRSVVLELSQPLAAAVKLAWAQYTQLSTRALALAQVPWHPSYSVWSRAVSRESSTLQYVLVCGWRWGCMGVSVMGGVLRQLGRGVRGVLCWVVARHPGVEQHLASLRQRAQSKADALASHPVSFGAEGEGSRSLRGSGRGGPRRWGRKLGARLCVVAVKMLSVPLAHRMLSRTASNSASLLSRSSSMAGYAHGAGGSMAGGSTMTLHGGHMGGAARTQPTQRQSSARVMSWLDPLDTPDYLLGQHAEMLQQHLALQQLQQQQQQQVGRGRGTPSPTAGAASPSANVSRLSRRQPVVVDGVCLAWDVPPAHAALPAPSATSQPRQQRQQRRPLL